VGRAYFNSQEWSPGECSVRPLCPLLSKLNEIVPKPGSVEYNAFQNEVSQYGGLLRSRIGLSLFSFDMIDSCERLGKYLHRQHLYDRMCDLKIRLAELNYDLGLPAYLEEVEALPALNAILLPTSQALDSDWKYAIDKIGGLTVKDVLGWIDNLSSGGSLSELKRPEIPGL
jgi:hypothetical protein